MSLLGSVRIVWAVHDMMRGRDKAGFPHERDAIAYARTKNRGLRVKRYQVERRHVIRGRAWV
jgi:hypothetical protein